jgi:hypothetical protein
MADVRPFDQLTGPQQEAAIDIVAGSVMIANRLPDLDNSFWRLLAQEFAAQHKIGFNVAYYAMKTIGENMWAANWRYEMSKTGGLLISHFVPEGSEGSKGLS